MLLKSRDGNELGIVPLSFEFPEVRDSDDPSNWLEVEVSVKSALGVGIAVVPLMRTSDMLFFAAWLNDLVDHRPGASVVAEYMLFPEPNLQLRYAADLGDEIKLEAVFNLGQLGADQLETAPNHQSFACSGRMFITVPRHQLQAAADSLRFELRQLTAHQQ